MSHPYKSQFRLSLSRRKRIAFFNYFQLFFGESKITFFLSCFFKNQNYRFFLFVCFSVKNEVFFQLFFRKSKITFFQVFFQRYLYFFYYTFYRWFSEGIFAGILERILAAFHWGALIIFLKESGLVEPNQNDLQHNDGPTW